MRPLIYFLSIVAVVVLALVPFVAPWLQFVLTLAIANGMVALGVAILLRAGLISIGHAMFFAMGAYCIAFLSKMGINEFFILLILGTFGSAIAGLIVGAFVVRYRAIFFAMLNLAISMVVYSLIAKMYSVTGGTDGMPLKTPTFFWVTLAKPGFDLALYYFSAVMMVVIGYVVHRYWKSPLGYALSAIESNELRLEYLGVSARSVLLAAYVASAAVAGIGGVIAGSVIGHILPDFGYWTASAQFVLIAALGGIGGAAGPFIGSFFLELLHSASVNITDAWNLITGIALIVVIVFLPSGLYGLFRKRHRSAP